MSRRFQVGVTMLLLLAGCAASSSSALPGDTRNAVSEAKKIEREMLDLFAAHDLYVMPILPIHSEKNFYLPFELARLLTSGALRESSRKGGTDHEILVRFAREVLLEQAAGLADLPESARRAVTFRPKSISAWWQMGSYNPFDAPPGLNFEESRQLWDYLERRQAVRASSSWRTEAQVLEELRSLDGVVFKAACFDRKLQQQCERLSAATQISESGSAAGEDRLAELRSRCSDLVALAACEESTFFYEEVDHIQDDVLALMVSALFKDQRSPPSWLLANVEKVLTQLVATSPMPIGGQPRLVVTDKPFSMMGMSGHVFGIMSFQDSHEIPISPSLLRAVPARCASSGRAVMLLMRARKGATAKGSVAFQDLAEAALIASLEAEEANSEPIVHVTLLPLLPRPGSLNQTQISDARLLSFVDDYWDCVKQSVEFPLAHELAHLALQLRCQGGDVACELQADCHALAHLESLDNAKERSGLSRLGFFFEIIVQSIEQGHPEFITLYQDHADEILDRYQQIEAGACRTSEAPQTTDATNRGKAS